MHSYNYQSELYHYGVKGMRWGVKKSARVVSREKSLLQDFSNVKLSEIPSKQTQKGVGFVTKHIRSIRLSKKEYGHVIHEVMTSLTATQRKRKSFSKSIGDYVYTFVNREGDIPIIVNRKKIK